MESQDKRRAENMATDESPNVKKGKRTEHFMKSGEFQDEITFSFDNNEKLYVSQSLLSHASPVFKAMFDSRSNFKENVEKAVKLVGKKPDDFLEFLYYIHSVENALQLATIADEYQVKPIIAQCQYAFELYLYKAKRNQCVRQCTRILNVSLKLNYDSIVKSAREELAKCGPNYITGSGIEPSCSEDYRQIPDDVKVKILLKRLDMIDDNSYRTYRTASIKS